MPQRCLASLGFEQKLGDFDLQSPEFHQPLTASQVSHTGKE